jgi:hypothetical protein
MLRRPIHLAIAWPVETARGKHHAADRLLVLVDIPVPLRDVRRPSIVTAS